MSSNVVTKDLKGEFTYFQLASGVHFVLNKLLTGTVIQ